MNSQNVSVTDRASDTDKTARREVTAVRESRKDTVALVGQPNVGKSVVMNLLTGAGAFVSNYPGTTVEVTEAAMLTPFGKIKVIDTPGTYSLHSDTDEQKVTQRVLLEKDVDLVINVVDARALARNLYLTLQLLDLEIPMIVVLNQMDMAEELGMGIDSEKLGQILGVPVVPMIASRGTGLDHLRDEIQTALTRRGETKGNHMTFSPRVDEDIFQLYPGLRKMVEEFQKKASGDRFSCQGCFRGCAFCPARDEAHPALETCLERTERARAIASQIITQKREKRPESLRGKAEGLLDNPATGVPILLLISYLAYHLATWFMGLAEEVVTLLFDPVTAWLMNLAGTFPQGSFLHIIISAVPEGLVLPFSVVMPAMVAIYFIMSILEDTGLLPRIAVAVDRLMSLFGLPGQSIVPLLLGFGCRAPAVLATRAMPDRKSRIVVSTMLAIVIPCAASLGIIAGLNTAFGANLGVIYGSMAIVFVILGLGLGRMMRYGAKLSAGGSTNPDGMDEPGTGLVMEIPPLRWPVLANVWAKGKMRLSGFFSHVLPILVVTSFAVRLLLDSGVLAALSRLDAFSLSVFGFPGEALLAVAVTVVQRYMAPMVLLNLTLTAREATIAGAMVALSMPCLPVSILIGKELGWKVLGKIMVLALSVSVGIGVVLNLVLP